MVVVDGTSFPFSFADNSKKAAAGTALIVVVDVVVVLGDTGADDTVSGGFPVEFKEFPEGSPVAGSGTFTLPLVVFVVCTSVSAVALGTPLCRWHIAKRINPHRITRFLRRLALDLIAMFPVDSRGYTDIEQQDGRPGDQPRFHEPQRGIR